MGDSLYQTNPEREPDEDFVAGDIRFLVAGNSGRMLDPRRTPIKVVGIEMDSGFFALEVQAFEDQGARWFIPFEDVSSFQFAKKSALADDAYAAAMSDVVERLNRTRSIALDPERRQLTLEELESAEARATRWLEEHSAFLRSGKTLPLASIVGDETLYDDLQRYSEAMAIDDVERAFATAYVSNPNSGDFIRAHRIVMAEMGLVPYEGKILRDEAAFDAPYTRVQRQRHIRCRLAFTRSLFRQLNVRHLTLYRGVVCQGEPEPPRNHTFVSASCARRIAEECAGATHDGVSGVVQEQLVPVKRVFISYFETRQMNEQFKEAEVLLLWEEGREF